MFITKVLSLTSFLFAMMEVWSKDLNQANLNAKRIPLPHINYKGYCPVAPGCYFQGLHAICMYPLLDFGPECEDPTKITMTPDTALRILTLFNLMRSRVANGLEQFGPLQEVAPKAYGMNLLHWDSELATMAQLEANQCHSGSITCHGTDRFPLSSQMRANIHFSESWIDLEDDKQYNFTNNFSEILMKLLSKVYMGKDKLDIKELYRCKTECLGETRFDEPEKFNAYPYVINSESTHVGCGLSTYVKRFHSNVQKQRIQRIVTLVCNFSHRLKVDDAICNFTSPTTWEYSPCGCGKGSVETKECLCTLSKDRCVGLACIPPVLLLPIFTAEPVSLSQNSETGGRSGVLRYVQEPPELTSTSKVTLNEVDQPKLEPVKLENEHPINTELAQTLLEEVTYPKDKRKAIRKTFLSANIPEKVSARNDDIQRPPSYNKHSKTQQVTAVYLQQRLADKTLLAPTSEHRSNHYKERRTRQHKPDKIEDVAPRKNYNTVKTIFNKYMQAKRQSLKENPYLKLLNDANGTDIISNNKAKDLKVQKTLKPPIEPDIYNNIHRNSETKPEQSFAAIIDKLEKQLTSLHITNDVRDVLDKKIKGIYDLLSQGVGSRHPRREGADEIQDFFNNQNEIHVKPKGAQSVLKEDLKERNRHKKDLRVKERVINTDLRSKPRLEHISSLKAPSISEEVLKKALKPSIGYRNQKTSRHLNKKFSQTHPSNDQPKPDSQYEKHHIMYDQELGYKRMRPVKAVEIKGRPPQNAPHAPIVPLGNRPILSTEQEKRHYDDNDDDDRDERSRDVERSGKVRKTTDYEDSSGDRRTKDYFEERNGRKLYA